MINFSTVPHKPTLQDNDAFERFNKKKKQPDKSIDSPLSMPDPISSAVSGRCSFFLSFFPSFFLSFLSFFLSFFMSFFLSHLFHLFSAPLDWSAEEQKLLEKGLSTVPATDPERWDKIAATIPGRSKKDCVARFKALVEQIKQKKAAATTGATTQKK
jgi:hypothetical protein